MLILAQKVNTKQFKLLLADCTNIGLLTPYFLYNLFEPPSPRSFWQVKSCEEYSTSSNIITLSSLKIKLRNYSENVKVKFNYVSGLARPLISPDPWVVLSVALFLPVTKVKTIGCWYKIFVYRILSAFSSGSSGKEESSLSVRTLKTLLATLCTGKLMAKLRYVFSQLSDSNRHLVHSG